MSLRVEDVMSRDVVTVDREYSVRYAARMMKYFSISSLVVVFEGKVEGILTERDVLTRVVTDGLDPEKVRVGEVMSRPVIVVSPTTPLEKAVGTMLKRRIKKLPVVDGPGEGSKLLGMLSLTDVARLHPKIVEAFRDMIYVEDEPEENGDFYIR